jgi:hypothetical protein
LLERKPDADPEGLIRAGAFVGRLQVIPGFETMEKLKPFTSEKF